jgi:hypothetical protein
MVPTLAWNIEMREQSKGYKYFKYNIMTKRRAGFFEVLSKFGGWDGASVHLPMPPNR